MEKELEVVVHVAALLELAMFVLSLKRPELVGLQQGRSKVLPSRWWSGCDLVCRSLNSVPHRVRHGFLWGLHLL